MPQIFSPLSHLVLLKNRAPLSMPDAAMATHRSSRSHRPPRASPTCPGAPPSLPLRRLRLLPVGAGEPTTSSPSSSSSSGHRSHSPSIPSAVDCLQSRRANAHLQDSLVSCRHAETPLFSPFGYLALACSPFHDAELCSPPLPSRRRSHLVPKLAARARALHRRAPVGARCAHSHSLTLRAPPVLEFRSSTRLLRRR